MPDNIILGELDEVDELFKKIEDSSEDELSIDVDLEAAASLAPQMSLKELEDTLVHSKCPMCGQELEREERMILRVVDPIHGARSWDCDSLGCATRLLKRMYKETRGISSSVEFVSTKKRKAQEPYAFEKVYDRR